MRAGRAAAPARGDAYPRTGRRHRWPASNTPSRDLGRWATRSGPGLPGLSSSLAGVDPRARRSGAQRTFHTSPPLGSAAGNAPSFDRLTSVRAVGTALALDPTDGDAQGAHRNTVSRIQKCPRRGPSARSSNFDRWAVVVP